MHDGEKGGAAHLEPSAPDAVGVATTRGRRGRRSERTVPPPRRRLGDLRFDGAPALTSPVSGLWRAPTYTVWGVAAGGRSRTGAGAALIGEKAGVFPATSVLAIANAFYVSSAFFILFFTAPPVAQRFLTSLSPLLALTTLGGSSPGQQRQSLTRRRLLALLYAVPCIAVAPSSAGAQGDAPPAARVGGGDGIQA